MGIRLSNSGAWNGRDLMSTPKKPEQRKGGKATVKRDEPNPAATPAPEDEGTDAPSDE